MFNFPLLTSVISSLLTCQAVLAQPPKIDSTEQTKQQLRESISFLASDALKGRATGSPEEDITVAYLVDKFKGMGLKPYFNDSFIDTFQLLNKKTVVTEASLGAVTLATPDDLIVAYNAPGKEFSLHVEEVIFVGFGVTAPSWHWDDFKNVDIKDKIIVVRVGDPGLEHPELFDGDKLSVFGRRDYKISEAVRRGAKGIIFLHNLRALGTPWQVYADTFANGTCVLPGDVAPELAYNIWMPEEKFKAIAEKQGINFTELYKSSANQDFQPRKLNLPIHIVGRQQDTVVNAHNVGALLSGESEKTIVITAHFDHVGSVVDPKTQTLKIFNGAIDNAAAVATMLVLADKITKQAVKPRHSILFLGLSAEEQGLLGSEYFASNVDRSKVLANINFELTSVFEKSNSIVAIAGDYSDLGDMVKNIASKNNLGYMGDINSPIAKGIVFRSDHFSFLRRKMPAVWLNVGPDYVSGQRHLERYLMTAYHKTTDVYSPDWDYGSTLQILDTAMELIGTLNAVDVVKVKGNLPFPVK